MLVASDLLKINYLLMKSSDSYQIADKEGELQPTLSMHPKKFAMWLFLVSVVMVFASLTSAYLVRRAEGNWVEFELPPIFWISTIVLLVSSVTMHMAVRSARRDQLTNVKIWLSVTFLLGVAFLIFQFYGWIYLVNINVFFVGNNVAGSFLYVLTGLHGLHIISAVVYLAWVLWATFRLKVHSQSLLNIELCATFWHFLDGLWLYLFLFLLFNHA
jgi:cytochrome c oxidase subunit 3